MSSQEIQKLLKQEWESYLAKSKDSHSIEDVLFAIPSSIKVLDVRRDSLVAALRAIPSSMIPLNLSQTPDTDDNLDADTSDINKTLR